MDGRATLFLYLPAPDRSATIAPPSTLTATAALSGPHDIIAAFPGATPTAAAAAAAAAHTAHASLRAVPRRHALCVAVRNGRIAEEEQGIIPRVITGMYDMLREATEERPNVSYSVKCQFLEIYGEDIHDLLEPAGSTVTIREGPNGEVNVHGAKEMLVNGAEVGGALKKM